MHLSLVIFSIYCIAFMQISALSHFSNSTALGEVRQERSLLYPFFSQLQLTLCTVSTIFGRKFGQSAVNLGFQIMYNLPWQLQDFYRPMYWARAVSDIVTGRLQPASNPNKLSRYKRDSTGFTAGQLYAVFEQSLVSMDFHEDCLAKSVCELAQISFSFEQDHLVHEIVYFILTPSEHQSFHSSEYEMKNRYELAEKAGRNRQNCDFVYPNCEKSILSTISAVENA